MKKLDLHLPQRIINLVQMDVNFNSVLYCLIAKVLNFTVSLVGFMTHIGTKFHKLCTNIGINISTLVNQLFASIGMYMATLLNQLFAQI